jgi:hypothetical protein
VPRWTFAAGPWDVGPERELTAAKGRKLTFRRRNAGSSLSFSIEGRDPEATILEELVTDVHAWRDGTRLFRGRVGPSSDDLDADHHKVAITVGDYRNVLERRLIFEGDAVLGAPHVDDIGDMAWALVALTQARASGTLGITEGTPTPIGLTMASTEFSAGQSITKAIDLFANTDPATTGFEWEIDPELRLVLYPLGAGEGVGQGRGRALGVILDYGGLVAKVKRTVDPSSYANVLRVSGATGVAPVERTAADLADRAEGRWESQLGHTDALTDAGLGRIADADLVDAQTIQPSYSVTLKADRWEGPSHLWLGDTVTLSVVSGRLDVLGDYQVEQLAVSVSDDGVETVELVLGSFFPGFDRRLASVEDRLRTLERR